MGNQESWKGEIPPLRPGEPRERKTLRDIVRFAAVVAVLLIVVFVVFERRLPADLLEPDRWLNANSSTYVAMALVVILLAADVLLPIPSSTLMIACGVAFGFVVGAIVACIGSTLAGVVGLLIGRVAPGRRFGRLDSYAGRLVARWGSAAVIATRPVPVLAETTAIVLGRTSMSVRTMALASATGSAVPAIVYAWVGARAESTVPVAVVVSILVGASVLAAIVGVLASRFGQHDSAAEMAPQL